MTLIEKRELLIKEIQQLPEEVLDKLLASISSKIENGKEENDFDKYLQETTQKYKKVWEALS